MPSAEEVLLEKRSPTGRQWEVQAPGLFTDLYELRMAEAYLSEGMSGEAVFTLSVRKLPPQRNYLIACGLDSLIERLESFRFGQEHIEYLREVGGFGEAFLDYLEGFRFGGDVQAAPEGTVLFPHEPILEVAAPLPEAQLLETLVLNQIHHQTLIASKASRIVTAAADRPVVDFGARRMHGLDAAVAGARAAFVAGVASTSNVLAGYVHGIPVAGTMAHSYVQAHESELAAFRTYASRYPETVLLVDTYDTLEGVHRVIDLARELGPEFHISAVRLDSGDLAALATRSRQLLDAAGLHAVKIFASGGLDEHEIDRLLQAEAPIDAFGVGTHMGVSSDAPLLDMTYKLVEYEGKPKTKLSPGKLVLPGRKQVFRLEENDRAIGDVIATANEDCPGRPLLRPAMRGGRRAGGRGSPIDARARAAGELASMSTGLRSLETRHDLYAVSISDRLQGKLDALRQSLAPAGRQSD
ncbi:nicotinate phosphoribosyltransferase [Lutibaculum baratangense]|uniref:Nicotinate phosphoribosyltransferase n=1 Tax=Lutibaculum baratangense AMV1 TaxID=631454 RepID=V4RJG0_9HYPH|nr:nicotinate phosphoribosyltransferase [Lutibaculum baratangense]ESR25459.1 Nicotinate phosphoribosyltransferase [Lutibaculum baratangense AMV1]